MMDEHSALVQACRNVIDLWLEYAEHVANDSPIALTKRDSGLAFDALETYTAGIMDDTPAIPLLVALAG